MEKSNFLHWGTITKVNRKTGEVSVIYTQKNFRETEPLQTIFIEIDGGLVPFFVDEKSAASADGIRLLLADYARPDLAQRFVGCKVYLPLMKNQEPDAFQTASYDEIIGYTVMDENDQALGVINDILESPEQDLVQIFRDEKEILIPLVEDFIMGLDADKKILFMELPDGLVELYLGE
jgi:16S rRNA processing protein RimM